MIDERKTLILQFNSEKNNWEDITWKVQWFEDRNNACRIKYVGSSTFYWKSWRELQIYSNPKSFDVTGKVILCNNKPLYGVSQLLSFGDYIKIFFGGKYTKIVKKESVKMISDITGKREVKTFIDYLKEIATLMPTEDGNNFLTNQLDNLVVFDNSVLGKLLQGKLCKSPNYEMLIYPFSTNASQRVAIICHTEKLKYITTEVTLLPYHMFRTLKGDG